MKLKGKKLRWHRNKSEIKDSIGYIYLTNNKGENVGIAKVDKEDLLKCILKRKWHLCKITGNVLSTKKEEMTSLGRYVLNINDDWLFVGHKNDDQLDCRKRNLFFATHINQFGVGYK